MTDDDRDLLAGEALGILSMDERPALEELVAKDRDAAAELKANRATISALESGVARTLPPDDLFGRVLAALEPTPTLAPHSARSRRPRHRGGAGASSLGSRPPARWPSPAPSSASRSSATAA